MKAKKKKPAAAKAAQPPPAANGGSQQTGEPAKAKWPYPVGPFKGNHWCYYTRAEMEEQARSLARITYAATERMKEWAEVLAEETKQIKRGEIPRLVFADYGLEDGLIIQRKLLNLLCQERRPPVKVIAAEYNDGEGDYREIPFWIDTGWERWYADVEDRLLEYFKARSVAAAKVSEAAARGWLEAAARIHSNSYSYADDFWTLADEAARVEWLAREYADALSQAKAADGEATGREADEGGVDAAKGTATAQESADATGEEKPRKRGRPKSKSGGKGYEPTPERRKAAIAIIEAVRNGKAHSRVLAAEYCINNAGKNGIPPLGEAAYGEFDGADSDSAGAAKFRRWAQYNNTTYTALIEATAEKWKQIKPTLK